MDCAVISSPQGGNKEVIDDGENGIMINNEEELTDAIKTLIDNPELRRTYSKQLKTKVLNNFEWSKTSEKILSDIKRGIKKYEK